MVNTNMGLFFKTGFDLIAESNNRSSSMCVSLACITITSGYAKTQLDGRTMFANFCFEMLTKDESPFEKLCVEGLLNSKS